MARPWPVDGDTNGPAAPDDHRQQGRATVHNLALVIGHELDTRRWVGWVDLSGQPTSETGADATPQTEVSTDDTALPPD